MYSKYLEFWQRVQLYTKRAQVKVYRRRVIRLILLVLLGLATTFSLPVLPPQSVARPSETITQLNAQLLLQQGIELYKTERFLEAVTTWQQANSAFVALGDNLGQALVLSNLTRCATKHFSIESPPISSRRETRPQATKVGLMFSMEEFIIAVFCCVDDWLKIVTQRHPIERRGFAPSLFDSEVITMEIVAEFQGVDADKAIWQSFCRHWSDLFPRLKSRSSFVRQAANLWQYKSLLHQCLAEQLGALTDEVHLIDGMPIRLCCFTRAYRCRSFKGEADYGYCAAKDEVYYGFHGHLLISAAGVITGFSATPANGNEREALWEIVPAIYGVLIGDKGYLSQWLSQELRQRQILLQTALRSNMDDAREPDMVKLFQRMRRLIETVIGQLTERFHFEKVRARDRWHLTSRLNRKLLAHTVCLWLNRRSSEPLQFDGLVTEN